MTEPVVIGVALRPDDRAPVALGRDLARFTSAPLAIAHVFPYEWPAPVSATADAAALQADTLLAIAQHVEPLCDQLDERVGKWMRHPHCSRIVVPGRLPGIRSAADRTCGQLLNRATA